MKRLHASLRILAGLAIFAGCQPAPALDSVSSPIVDGSRESGFPEVMFLYNIAGGGACTATLISPRVVLTAKHCVQNGNVAAAAPASSFRLFVGESANRPSNQYLVSEVIPAPGRWDLRDASDVALLILTAPARETPREVSFDNPAFLAGRAFTAIGYGQTPSGSSGVKMRVQKTVDGSNGGFIFVRPSVCSGDSGGPLIGPDDRIYGVASFIYSETGSSSPRCGSAPGAYNGLTRYQSMIESAIEESGGCVPAEEICNGADDNCDGTVDEGCTAFGETCFESSDCSSTLCDTTSAGRICTQSCDPLRPTLGCPAGSFCENIGGCEGRCAPQGDTALRSRGDECDDASQCVTGFCAALGETTKRCHAPCRDAAGMCLAGEVCFAEAGSCGACVNEHQLPAPRDLGEPCAADEECTEGLCIDDAGLSYCSRMCTDHEACGENFHCREGTCIRGPLGAVGDPCAANEDCGDGVCVQQGERSWCSSFCSEDTACPEGFHCPGEESPVCVPDAGVVGDTCMENTDCIDGLCVDGTARGQVCSTFCDAGHACGPGFECVRVGDTGVCVQGEASAPPSSGGGCAATGTNGGKDTLFGLFLLAGWAVLRRRSGR